MLELRDVSIAYPGREPIVNNISLSVNEGEMLALIGTNGSGKTTLIRGLTGLLPLRGGDIFFNNQSLNNLSARERARLISVVPQAANIPPGYTVYETVAHGRTPYLNWYGKLGTRDKAVIDRAVSLTGLTDIADKDVGSLSGGQQQRVIFARAAAQDSPVMVMDEPTAFLDLRYQVEMLNLARAFCREGTCAIVILHDLNLAARFADRIAILSKGRIRDCGTPREVLTAPALSEVYETPIRVLNDPAGGIIILPATRQQQA